MDTKHFFIISNQYKDPDGEISGKIKDYLESKEMKCTLWKPNPNIENKKYLYTDANDVPDDTDCIIALGGDGTILQASRDLHYLKIPILGINIGTVGFLTDTDLELANESLDRYISGEYEIAKRMMIWGEIVRDGKIVYDNFALNEAVINRSGGLKVIDFDIYVNKEFLNTYFADGVIITTATGSTAYSLSAGGPIIKPNGKMMMITPICPHTLNSRSIILDPDDEIIIEITDKKKVGEGKEITFDGETSFKLETGDKIYIRRFPEEALFIRTNKISFLQRIRQCFV